MTDPKAKIAERLEQAGLGTDRFITCQDGSKASVDHTQHEPSAVQPNYGIYANLNDGLVWLDIDDYDDIDDMSGLQALMSLPPTLEQRSPHGGTHRAYAVKPADGRMVAAVLEDEFGTKNPNPSWGEVRAANQYVVGAGSQLDGCDKAGCHTCASPDGGSYALREDRAIAMISAETLVDALAADPQLRQEDETAHPAPEVTDATVSEDYNVDERLQVALEQDAKLDRLWRGDYSDYREGGDVDRSRAESALAMKLAFWFGGDKRQVRRLMDRANTKKWAERPDESYRASVLEAVDQVTDHYQPGGDGPVSAPAYERERATDGGTAAATPDDSGGPDHTPLRERVLQQVIEPLEDEDNGITEQVARERLANLLLEEYSFVRPREDVRGWRDTLYVYDDSTGIYEPHGETFIERETERLMGAWTSNQRVNEIVGKIERRSRVDGDDLTAAPERLVVANGILDLTTGDLDDHTPEEYHRTHVPVAYDPDAECPRLDDFFHDIVADGDVPTLYRLVAHTLYKEYAAEKAAMLLGDGRNGKSVFLSLVEHFLGEHNVSNQSLQALNEDEWAANNLVGKLANVHPDLSDQTVETMQVFKKLTGRDTVSANVKFESPVRFENHATLLFACNRMPVMDDDTRGNWRRWLLIDFPNTFEPDAEETIEKHVLMDDLTAEEELQGLLTRCVEEIREWDSGRAWFPSAPDWEQTRQQIRRAAEPVYDFAHACLEEIDDGCEPKKAVRRAYNAYATAEGLPSMGAEQFGQKLINQTEMTIESTQRRVNGQRVHVYDGVQFTDRGRQLAENGVGGASEDGDMQSSFGGPQGRAQTIVRLAREHVPEEGDGLQPAELIGLAMGKGMDRETAQHALQKARNQGDLAGPDDGPLLPT